MREFYIRAWHAQRRDYTQRISRVRDLHKSAKKCLHVRAYYKNVRYACRASERANAHSRCLMKTWLRPTTPPPLVVRMHRTNSTHARSRSWPNRHGVFSSASSILRATHVSKYHIKENREIWLFSTRTLSPKSALANLLDPWRSADTRDEREWKRNTMAADVRMLFIAQLYSEHNGSSCCIWR